MLKKFPSGKISGTKNALIFLSRSSVLFLICNSDMSWSTRFVSLKLWVGFFIFDSVLFLLKFIFLFDKKLDSFTLKPHNYFQNENNRKATHSFAPRPLVFKLQQECLKFSDTCLSCSSLKVDLEMNFLNLENRSFENVSFSQ